MCAAPVKKKVSWIWYFIWEFKWAWLFWEQCLLWEFYFRRKPGAAGHTLAFRWSRHSGFDLFLNNNFYLISFFAIANQNRRIIFWIWKHNWTYTYKKCYTFKGVSVHELLFLVVINGIWQFFSNFIIQDKNNPGFKTETPF